MVRFDTGYQETKDFEIAALPFRMLRDTDSLTQFGGAKSRALILIEVLRQVEHEAPGMMMAVFQLLSEENERLSFDVASIFLMHKNGWRDYYRFAIGACCLLEGAIDDICCAPCHKLYHIRDPPKKEAPPEIKEKKKDLAKVFR